jgi:hypothetical protein
MAGPAGRPTIRNALMTFLVPILMMVVAPMVFGIIGSILGTALESGAIAAAMSGIGSLVYLAGLVIYLISGIKMIGELRSASGNESIVWWPLIIPLYNIYFMWFMVPGAVAQAKQRFGVQQPARNIVLYIFVWLFALASDLNDVARAMPAQ